MRKLMNAFVNKQLLKTAVPDKGERMTSTLKVSPFFNSKQQYILASN